MKLEKKKSIKKKEKKKESIRLTRDPGHETVTSQ
jgi:hypothetical protein